MAFQGAVDRFSLADVFRSLAMKQLTGTLRVHIQDGPERRLHFESGQVRALDSGRQKPLRLGEMLLGRGVLSQEQIDAALERQKTTRQSLGNCLIEMHLLDADTLDGFLARQIEEGILELLAWQNARYEFTVGPPPEGFFGDRLARSAPFLSAAQLVMEAGKRVDEWDRMRQEIPSFREIYVLADRFRGAGFPPAFDAESTEFRLAPWLDGRRDVEDLIEESALFRFEILQALTALKQAHVIRPATVEELQAVDQALIQSGQTRRRTKILERLLALGVDRAATRLALVEVLAESGETEKTAGHLGLLAEEALAAHQPDQAMAHLRRGIELAPQHLPLLERLGALHVQRNEVVEALQQFDQLSRTYRERRQWNEARAACVQILKLEPNDSAARRALIEICMEMGDRASAVRECETLCEVLHRQGLPDDAARYIQRALEIEPQREDLQKKLVALNSRPKRTVRAGRVMLCLIVVVVLVALGVPAGREFIMNAQANRALLEAETIRQAAEALEKKGDFTGAAQKYESAAQSLKESPAARAWTLLGQNRRLDAVATDLTVQSQRARGQVAPDKP